LVAAQDDQVRLLLIKHLGKEIKRPGISLAFASLVTLGNRLSALANAIAEVQISDLHNFEPPIVRDSRLRLLLLMWHASSHSEMSAEHISAGVEV
jgi:hypothetical protein